MSNLKSPSVHLPSDHQSGSPSAEKVPTEALSSSGSVGHHTPATRVRDKQYQYDSSLDQNHIRLLEFLPDDSDYIISCILKTYPLAKAPSYHALSYVWGHGDRDSPILCCGEELNITRSLHATLLAIRMRHYFESSPHGGGTVSYYFPRLWIDQICINQQDTEERNRQVRIMRTIYRGADSVLISLGEDFAGPAKSVSHLIRAVYNMKSFNLVDPPWKGCFPPDKVLVDMGLPESTHNCWSALETMLSMPYFERVWVVQEVIMAKKALIIHEGGVISWNSFLRTMFWFFRHKWDIRNASILAINYSVPHNDVLDIYCDFWSKRGKRSKTLYSLARRLRTLKSTLPKDKIFAIAGIADDGNEIALEYRKLDWEVFEDFARYTINAEKNLNILSDVTHDDKGRGDTPSWVPRWDAPSSFLDKRNKDSKTIYNSEVSIHPQQESKVLKVKGKNLAVVTSKVLRFDFDPPLKDTVANMTLSLLEKGFLTSDEALTPCAKRIKELAWCIIVGEYSVPVDETPSDDRADGQVLHDLSAYFANGFLYAMHREDHETAETYIQTAQIVFEAVSDYISTRPNGSLELNDMFKNWIERLRIQLQTLAPSLLQDRPSVDKFLDDVFRALDWDRQLRYNISTSLLVAPRSFFITNDGYMGVGPPNLEETDVICVLYGGPRPYALRRTSPPGSYNFLGDCYIPGHMDLESFLNSSDKPDKWFRLI